MYNKGGAMFSTQLVKGILPSCILIIISQEPTYGYEISQSLAAYGFGVVSEGTIYPLLLRLEKNGLIAATYRKSELGPKRKYYELTDLGKQELSEFKDDYLNFDSVIKKMISDISID